MADPGYDSSNGERRPSPRAIVALRQFIDHRYTGAAIICLIILSVALTVYEFSLPPDLPLHHRLAEINHAVTLLFVVELILRFLAMRRRRRFFQEYWLDLLAVLPVFRAFRLFRAARLLRLLRLLRLFRIGRLIRRHIASLPDIFRRSVVEYTILACFLLFTIICGSLAMLIFEQQSPGGEFSSFDKTFWWSVYTLLAGESITQFPATLAGRVTAAAVMFLGLGVFALVTGTVSAVMVERLTRLERMEMDFDELDHHVLICGYSRKVSRIVEEIMATDGDAGRQIVIIADPEHREAIEELVRLLDPVDRFYGDFTRAETLEKAGATRCDVCIIVTDRSHQRTEQDADARTILAALTIEKLNPRVFTCAELNNSDYISHLERGGVDDVVIGGEHSALLLAQAAINRGLGDLLSELLTSRRGSQFYKVPVPNSHVGRTFLELLAELKADHGAILLGYERGTAEQVLNPREYVAELEDRLILIASKRVILSGGGGRRGAG